MISIGTSTHRKNLALHGQFYPQLHPSLFFKNLLKKSWMVVIIFAPAELSFPDLKFRDL
jgi:hypothetical protein